MAASSGFLLGLDYSEWADPTASQIATDASGNRYIFLRDKSFRGWEDDPVAERA